MLVWRKSDMQLSCKPNSSIFYGASFLLERTSDKQNLVSGLGYLSVISWKINEWASHLKANSLRVFFANEKTWAFKWKFEFWKICIHHHQLDSFWILKSSMVMLTNVISKQILDNEACQWYNSMKQYLQSNHYKILQNHAYIKEPFKVQVNQWIFMNFKFIDMVSDSPLQSTF